MADMRTWVYHKTEAPKIVLESEAEELYENGYADSPAKFFDMESHGLDPGDKAQVQQAGEALKGVKDALNGALNLEEMTKKELASYAKLHYGVTLNTQKRKEALLEEIKAILNK